MNSLYRLCRMFGTKARRCCTACHRQLLGKGRQVFAGRSIDLEAHELGGLGNQVGIGGREPGPLRFVVLVVAEDDERGGGRGLLGSGLGFGGGLGHGRSPETPKAPSEQLTLGLLGDAIGGYPEAEQPPVPPTVDRESWSGEH